MSDKSSKERVSAGLLNEIRATVASRGDDFIICTVLRIIDELLERRAAETSDDRSLALQDLAYRNGAQQALAMAHQSLKAADDWLADLWKRSGEARAVLKSAGETTAPTKGRAACDCKRDGMGMMRPCPDKPDDRYCRLAHQRCEHCPEETLVEHLQRQEREESSVKATVPPNEGASREAPSKEPL